MKLLLLVAVLLGLGCVLPGHAQQLPVLAPALRPALTHADSVTALRKVFRRNRLSGRFAGLLEGALLPIVIAGAANPSPAISRQVAGAQVVTAAVAAVYFVGSIVRWSRFSQRREQEAVERFEQHALQPRYVQRSFDRLLVQATQPPHHKPTQP